tara:strand:- start:6575 stop:6745 length:171 start_codon:yes stop_codon:yes gene_type:complete
MTEFLQMGGYALYVWPAYAVTAVTLAVSVVVPIRRRNRLLRELAAMATPKERSPCE